MPREAIREALEQLGGERVEQREAKDDGCEMVDGCRHEGAEVAGALRGGPTSA
jgi:hypothetical protein